MCNLAILLLETSIELLFFLFLFPSFCFSVCFFVVVVVVVVVTSAKLKPDATGLAGW